MANGTAALALLPPEHLSKDAPTEATPGAVPAATEIERQIGEAAAGAAIAIAYAMTAYATSGQLTDAARAVGGECLGQLAQLRLDTLGQVDDFFGVAHKQGRHALYAGHGAALRQQLNLNEAELDKALTELVGWAVTIAEKVARDEQALQRAWAN